MVDRIDESELRALRERYDDGILSETEWTGVINAYLEEDRRKNGTISIPPTEWETTYTFPVNEHFITEDFIRRYARAIGDSNPLYHHQDYGRRTQYGSIIGPPIFAAGIANAGAFPDKPEIPGWNAFYGGTENLMYKVIRPGDRIRVINKYLGIEEKDSSGKPYRLFTPRNQKIFMNERDEVVAKSTANEVVTAMPPGTKKKTGEKLYAGRERRCFTPEELEVVHRSYDEELEGKGRRGAQVLYWEDVVEGEELPQLIRGPLDVSDIVSWLGASGYIFSFALKWKALKSDLKRCLIDPETGEHHNAIDWHYLDSMARVAGLPYAFSVGRQNEAIVAHCISNWMGDDGFLKRLYCAHRGVWFHGEVVYVKGKVKRKYVENSEHLVDLDAWTELADGKKCTVGEGTVKLISRAD
jgi:acyl dehydratase